MIPYLLLLALISFPWRLEGVFMVMQAPIDADISICGEAPACISGPYIHIDLDAHHADEYLAHELQHYMQLRTGIEQEQGGYDKFLGIVLDLMASGYWNNQHQTESIKGLSHAPCELHASLPGLLKGEIPHELADWYPWFAIQK